LYVRKVCANGHVDSNNNFRISEEPFNVQQSQDFHGGNGEYSDVTAKMLVLEYFGDTRVNDGHRAADDIK